MGTDPNALVHATRRRAVTADTGFLRVTCRTRADISLRLERMVIWSSNRTLCHGTNPSRGMETAESASIKAIAR